LYDTQSPNYDSLIWYLDYVWPRIRAARAEETLRIAGFVRPEVPLDPLRRDGVILLGPVTDLTSEYGRARVFVAQTGLREASHSRFRRRSAMVFRSCVQG
jgi:O-antigen biosynthesis protein